MNSKKIWLVSSLSALTLVGGASGAVASPDRDAKPSDEVRQSAFYTSDSASGDGENGFKRGHARGLALGHLKPELTDDDRTEGLKLGHRIGLGHLLSHGLGHLNHDHPYLGDGATPPVTEEPEAEAPAEEPADEDTPPVTDEPDAEAPENETPADEPVAEEPTDEAPEAELPADEVPTEEPTDEIAPPVSEAPVDDPVVVEPPVEEPVIEAPDAQEPVADAPVSEEPDATDPAAVPSPEATTSVAVDVEVAVNE